MTSSFDAARMPGIESHVQVMKARFGIDGDKRKTLEGIGRRYGLSRERVRQIEMDALLKLRQPYHAYRELEANAEELMMYSETPAPDTAAVEAASAEVAEAEAAAKVAQLNYMRARLGMPRAAPEAAAPRRKPETVPARGREGGAGLGAGDLAEVDKTLGSAEEVFRPDEPDPSVSGESPEDWARRMLSGRPLLGTEADKRAYGRQGRHWQARQGGDASADAYETVEVSAKSLMALGGNEREAWSAMIEQTEPWSGPVEAEGSERLSLDAAAEQWSFGVESTQLSGDMTPEQWERALTAME